MRLDKMSAQEAKYCCDSMGHALSTLETSIRSMLSDAQTLRDASYHQADLIHARYDLTELLYFLHFCLDSLVIFFVHFVHHFRKIILLPLVKEYVLSVSFKNVPFVNFFTDEYVNK